MLIDQLAEIWSPETGGTALYLLFAALAGICALLLHRWGQVRSRKKTGDAARFFNPKEWRYPETAFYWLFFLLTGALKASPLPDAPDRKPKQALRLLFAGFRFNLYGAAAALLLYTFVQFLGVHTALPRPDLFLLFFRAMTAANLSAMWVNLLPLPGFDGGASVAAALPERLRERFVRAKTVTFFLFAALAIFLARAGVLHFITAFPFLWIDG